MLLLDAPLDLVPLFLTLIAFAAAHLHPVRRRLHIAFWLCLLARWARSVDAFHCPSFTGMAPCQGAYAQKSAVTPESATLQTPFGPHSSVHISLSLGGSDPFVTLRDIDLYV